MAVTQADFNRIWASTSPLTPYNFSNTNYLQGWNFVGSTPPARQMWDKYMNLADQKMQYLYNNYLPLAGGILSGYLQFNGLDSRIISSRADRDGAVSIYGGDGYTTGSYAAFYGINHDSNAGRFIIRAVTDGSKYKELQGRPDGTLTWGGKNIERVESSGTNYIRYANGLQMCWGTVGNMTEAGMTVTFPQPFVTAPAPSLVSTSVTAYPYLTALTATDMTVKTNNNGGFIRYTAIGRWA